MTSNRLAKTPDRPNLLIVFPDEMRADAMGCAGNPVLKTPYCDRLAQEGSLRGLPSFPLCTPSASLFTGKTTMPPRCTQPPPHPPGQAFC